MIREVFVMWSAVHVTIAVLVGVIYGVSWFIDSVPQWVAFALLIELFILLVAVLTVITPKGSPPR